MDDKIVKLEMGPPPATMGPGAVIKVDDDHYKIHHRVPDGVIASLCNDAEITILRQGEARPITDNEAGFAQVYRDEVQGLRRDRLAQELGLNEATVTADIQTTYANAQRTDTYGGGEPPQHQVTGYRARLHPEEVPATADWDPTTDTYTWQDHRGTFTIDGERAEILPVQDPTMDALAARDVLWGTPEYDRQQNENAERREATMQEALEYDEEE